MTLRPVNAEFIGSYPDPKMVPKLDEPQLLCVGRSNVGKSTLINRLAGQKQLARTSSTPGRTQAINLFRIFLMDEDGNKSSIILADLPGYGYAKVGKKDRRYFEELILGYIEDAKRVRALLLLQDGRRSPGEEEIIIRDIAFENGHIVHVVLTKVDKLKKNDIKKNTLKVAKAFSLEADDVLVSGEKTPISNIYRHLESLLA